MKLLIEVPDNWLDDDKLSNLSFITSTCRQELQKILLDEMTNALMKEALPLPKITITPEELKKAILDRQVEEFLNK